MSDDPNGTIEGLRNVLRSMDDNGHASVIISREDLRILIEGEKEAGFKVIFHGGQGGTR